MNLRLDDFWKQILHVNDNFSVSPLLTGFSFVTVLRIDLRKSEKGRKGSPPPHSFDLVCAEIIWNV